jgi:UDP-N-acetylglucosamine acyltransferase
VIDPRAVVDPGAQLAPDVQVGPFAIIGAEARIGARTRIGPHAIVTGRTTLGEDNVVFAFASLGEAPQDLKYNGEPTQLTVGDRNVFREFCTINRGTTHDDGVTRIGSDNLFMNHSHVAHDCQLGNRIVMVNNATLGGHVHIGDWVILAGFSGVHQFCKIGAHAFIANNCAVTRDVPPYVMAVGQPARPHSINSKGLERRGFDAEHIRHIRDAYRTLYRQGLPLAEAQQALAERVATQPELRLFVEFIAASTRSLIR